MRKKRLTKMKKKEIMEKANSVLSKYNLSATNKIDVVALANRAGFKVGESKKMLESDDGFMVVAPAEKGKVIGVNFDRSIEDKRFIIAHEMGHFFLHRDKLISNGAIMHRQRKKGKGALENEADFFAASILMPRESFKKEYENLKDLDYESQISTLQKIFLAPRESVERRVAEVCDD